MIGDRYGRRTQKVEPEIIAIWTAIVIIIVSSLVIMASVVTITLNLKAIREKTAPKTSIEIRLYQPKAKTPKVIRTGLPSVGSEITIPTNWVARLARGNK